MFSDVEKALQDGLKAAFTELADPDEDHLDEHVGAETPADLQSRFPFVRVNRVGGGGSRLEDGPMVDVEVFDSDRDDAYALAEAIRSLLLDPPVVLGGARIDNVEVEIGPRRLPWDSAGTIRISATYSLITRRR